MAITVYKPTPSCDGVYSFSDSQLAEYVRVHVEEAVRLERERSTIWCPDCGDSITAHDPGVCGNCLAMKYDIEDAVAREREACAVLCEMTPSQWGEGPQLAAAIRARSQEGQV